MSNFTDLYRDLLIKQYWDKPNARAEIEFDSSRAETLRDTMLQMFDAVDIDQATGDQLDLIGRIVGLNRSIPSVIPPPPVIRFGFADNPDARTFDDLFNPVELSAPFAELFELNYTSLQLDDVSYRSLLRAKIAKNNTSAYLVADDRVSLNDVIQVIFDGFAYVIDNYNMSISLYIDTTIDVEYVSLANNTGLLPNPQGVKYRDIVQADPFGSFGFSDNPTTKGFADLFDPLQTGGTFANQVLI